ncbi:hypothetical protein RvY_00119 [Ramazzottius varieornatus]|uniref:Uncharacterized protein n=1 Tax=Ramazzottius varieornatus TaxID=947166 RepID=A0A1D1UC40_RAMVA|nr:hypothetical protein RvY_00119 [Ramazzottius varieornatus]
MDPRNKKRDNETFVVRMKCLVSIPSYSADFPVRKQVALEMWALFWSHERQPAAQQDMLMYSGGNEIAAGIHKSF